MTIHHSGVVFTDNRTIAERLRQHQRYHQDEHGWIDIAYHVGIDRGGNVFALRDTGLIGDTATDYDPAGHFLVLCEGDFDQQDVPEPQLESAALVLAWAAQTFQISTDTLASHREVAPATTCPGAHLQAHIASGELRRRVDDLASRGPVGLALKCSHEAAAIMVAIEAGR
nr:peptidoglycan recognition family protein [Mycolicibacter sinensis]